MLEYPPESNMYIEAQDKERISYAIHDDVVIFDGKTEIGEEMRLFWANHPIHDYTREAKFYVKYINFIVIVGDLTLASKVINSSVFSFLVGHKPMYGPCSISLGTNFKKIALDPPVLVERNQHFCIHFMFGDIEKGPSEISEVLMKPRRTERLLLLEDNQLEEPTIVEPPKRNYENFLEEFNDYDGLKVIRCVLDGILERAVC